VGRPPGWHDEWRVTGTHPSGEPFERLWDSRDPRWPEGYAEVAARAFVKQANSGRVPWEDGPYLWRARVFRGEWEQVLPAPAHEQGRPRTPVWDAAGRPRK
jgi:hypothetical protein